MIGILIFLIKKKPQPNNISIYACSVHVRTASFHVVHAKYWRWTHHLYASSPPTGNLQEWHLPKAQLPKVLGTLPPWCIPRCISVLQFYMKTRLFGDYLALRWGVGVEGFLLFAEAVFPWGSLAAAPREYTPCWQFTSRGLRSSWLTNNKQKTK